MPKVTQNVSVIRVRYKSPNFWLCAVSATSFRLLPLSFTLENVLQVKWNIISLRHYYFLYLIKSDYISPTPLSSPAIFLVQ